MKKTLLALMGILILTGTMVRPIVAGGRADKVEVDFSALKDLSDKKGRTLDGSVKFYFADEKTSLKGGDELSARGAKVGHGPDDERCAQALLVAFLSFQERAKREGKTAVINIRTYSSSTDSSGSRKSCQCIAGGFNVHTTVKGQLAGGN
jgi:hypothetical protein